MKTALIVLGVFIVIVNIALWGKCTNKGGEFVKGPFEIGYHCTK